MVRVMMLAPFLIGLSAWLARNAARKTVIAGSTSAADGSKRRLTVPWFAFAFVAVVVFNSQSLLPHRVLGAATGLDTFLLAMAMAALGLTTHLAAIRQAGIKPLLLGGVLFVWLIGGGAIINSLVTAWLR
jgi:uncharacterized integral membrane protein (TIGR00698 family)